MSKHKNNNKDIAQFWQFKNSTAVSNEATLYVYGDIVTYDYGEWNYPDDVVPNKFKDELNALTNASTIHVRINSGGGSVFGAYAIMNLLKAHKAQIIVHIDGIAASAATLIAMAGDKIISAIGSVFMIHPPSTWAWGNSQDFQKTIEVLNTITDSMVDVYHAKTGIAKEDLIKMIENDTWLTGSEALEKGFADEMETIEVEAYLSDDKTTAFFNGLNINLDNFHNKERFVAMLPSKSKSQPKSQPPNIPSNSIEKDNEENIIMNLAELQAKYPNLYAEAVSIGKTEGFAEGVTAERKRIKDIDDMSLLGTEAMTNKAKYETGITASEYAMELIKAQKQQGANFLAGAKADAAEAGEVPPAGAPQDDQSEEDAILNHTKETGKTITRTMS